MTDAGYVCSLDDTSLKKAKRELNEDPKDRLAAVAALRDWTKRQSKWMTCPTDTKFLLAFLRVSKFSQLTARERLANFLASFNDSVSYLKGVDPGEEKYLKILRTSRVYTPLPKTDKEGRTVILGNYEHFDSSGSSYSYADFQRSILGICHSLVFCDEQFQVNGVNFLMDYGAVTLKHLSFGGIDNLKKRSIHFQKALPVPMKAFHHYNMGPVFDILLGIIKPTLPEKMRVRVFIHGHSMLSVYRQIDMSLLPDEYLPDDYDGPSAGTMDDITERNIQELILNPERRAFIKDLWSGKYGADISLKNDFVEDGSFRQLVI